MKKFLRIMCVAVAACLVLTALAGCGGEGKKNVYLIGCTGPLTGDASSYGISVKQGATVAVEEINKNGGLNGVEFAFDMKDDKATAEDANTGYDALYDAGMLVSLGSVTSGSCAAFAEKAAKDNIFVMTPSASAADVIEKGTNTFRICFGDPDQGILAAEELSANFKNIGCIYDTSDPYSSGIYEAFKSKMAELKKEFITKTFDKENNKDFSTQVEALKDCDVIFLPFYYTEAGLVSKACVQKGVKAELFGCDGLDGITSQIDSTVTNRIRYITPFNVASTDEKVANFVKTYKDKFGAEPDQFAADGYDAVYAIYNAMKTAGINDTSIKASELCDKLVETITASDFSYDGLTGKMTWDKTGAATKVPVIVELGK